MTAGHNNPAVMRRLGSHAIAIYGWFVNFTSGQPAIRGWLAAADCQQEEEKAIIYAPPA